MVGQDGPLDLDAFTRTVRVNLVGTFNMVRLAAQAMADQDADDAPDGEVERGVIVTTSSIAAFGGEVGQTAYAASKGGVASLTLPLARELAPPRDPRGLDRAGRVRDADDGRTVRAGARGA